MIEQSKKQRRKKKKNKGRPRNWLTNKELTEIAETLKSPKFLLARKILQLGLIQKPDRCPICGSEEYIIGFHNYYNYIRIRCLNCKKERFYSPFNKVWTEK
jgi:hypothetical protein